MARRAGITRSNLSNEHKKKLQNHLETHRLYPYRYRFSKDISVAANFPNLDPASPPLTHSGRYATVPILFDEYVGIVGISANFKVHPDSQGIVDPHYFMALSHSEKYSVQDLTPLPNKETQDQGQVFYELMSNGGAINDSSSVYPLNYYVEQTKKIFLHIWVDEISHGTFTIGRNITAHLILHTLPTGVS